MYYLHCMYVHLQDAEDTLPALSSAAGHKRKRRFSTSQETSPMLELHVDQEVKLLPCAASGTAHVPYGRCAVEAAIMFQSAHPSASCVQSL